MSEHDDETQAPWPTGVIPGGAPDPVVSTAPQADPPPEAETEADELVQEGGAPIYPVSGAQTGAVAPPPVPRQQ
ncbi:hypothetical protein [Cellulomonas sp. HZM]|uniref:hypothetical protein n=1 Tax=Cellulomonas sp. HZM TaxID=1454010 RepID=UPI0012DE8943|nr:hypothetical protein [Cellulomonas sp. HZM]